MTKQSVAKPLDQVGCDRDFSERVNYMNNLQKKQNTALEARNFVHVSPCFVDDSIGGRSVVEFP
jgi:hypothetical protein